MKLPPTKNIISAMKTILAMLLAVLTFAAIAKADTILIYGGSHTDHINGGAGKTVTSFLIFDLNTLQFAEVEYGNSGGKFTALFGPTAMVSDPIDIPKGKTETCLAFGATTTTSPFLFKVGTYIGTNSTVSIGGAMTGPYAKVLTYTYRALAGDGMNADDDVTTSSGVYQLNTTLTEKSNNAADNLTGGTNVVNTYLTTKGF